MVRRKQRRICPGIRSETDKHTVSFTTKLSTKVKENAPSGRGKFTDKILGRPTAGLANINAIRLDTSTETTKSNITTLSRSSGGNCLGVTAFTKYAPHKHLASTRAPSMSDSNFERRVHQRKAFTLLGLVVYIWGFWLSYFPPIFPHFFLKLKSRTTFQNLLNILKTT